MPDVNTATETSTAAVEAPQNEALKNVHYDNWNEKGTPIVSKKTELTPKAQDSAPVEKSSEAKAESAAESEAAKISQEKSQAKAKPKLTADERIAELEATIAKIRENAGKRETKTQAESSTAKSETKAAEAPQELKAPTKPKLDDKNPDGSAKYKTYEEFEDAKDRYQEERTTYEVAKALREDRMRQAAEAGMRELARKVDEAKSRYDNFDVQKIDEAAGQIIGDKDIPAMVKARFQRSDVLPDLLYTMTGDEADFQSFLKLAKSDPLAALDKLVLTESLVKDALKKGTAKRGVEGEDKTEDKKTADVDQDAKGEAKKETPEDRKPRAPTPPSEVGGRGTAPGDALVAAARANDFRAFEAEESRRKLAPRK